jgi:hypothetical protein
VSAASRYRTFGDLSVSATFVSPPVSSHGDGAGHGGLEKSSYVFKKTEPRGEKFPTNSFRLQDGIHSLMPDSMPVIEVVGPGLLSAQQQLNYAREVNDRLHAMITEQRERYVDRDRKLCEVIAALEQRLQVVEKSVEERCAAALAQALSDKRVFLAALVRVLQNASVTQDTSVVKLGG